MRQIQLLKIGPLLLPAQPLFRGSPALAGAPAAAPPQLGPGGFGHPFCSYWAPLLLRGLKRRVQTEALRQPRRLPSTSLPAAPRHGEQSRVLPPDSPETPRTLRKPRTTRTEALERPTSRSIGAQTGSSQPSVPAGVCTHRSRRVDKCFVPWNTVRASPALPTAPASRALVPRRTPLPHAAPPRAAAPSLLTELFFRAKPRVAQLKHSGSPRRARPAVGQGVPRRERPSRRTFSAGGALSKLRHRKSLRQLFIFLFPLLQAATFVLMKQLIHVVRRAWVLILNSMKKSRGKIAANRSALGSSPVSSSDTRGLHARGSQCREEHHSPGAGRAERGAAESEPKCESPTAACERQRLRRVLAEGGKSSGVREKKLVPSVIPHREFRRLEPTTTALSAP